MDDWTLVAGPARHDSFLQLVLQSVVRRTCLDEGTVEVAWRPGGALTGGVERAAGAGAGRGAGCCLCGGAGGAGPTWTPCGGALQPPHSLLSASRGLWADGARLRPAAGQG